MKPTNPHHEVTQTHSRVPPLYFLLHTSQLVTFSCYKKEAGNERFACLQLNLIELDSGALYMERRIKAKQEAATAVSD
jgi:hypothetical protein